MKNQSKSRTLECSRREVVEQNVRLLDQREQGLLVIIHNTIFII